MIEEDEQDSKVIYFKCHKNKDDFLKVKIKKPGEKDTWLRSFRFVYKLMFLI